jgi:hypothetical protein
MFGLMKFVGLVLIFGFFGIRISHFCWHIILSDLLIIFGLVRIFGFVGISDLVGILSVSRLNVCPCWNCRHIVRHRNFRRRNLWLGRHCWSLCIFGFGRMFGLVGMLSIVGMWWPVRFVFLFGSFGFVGFALPRRNFLPCWNFQYCRNCQSCRNCWHCRNLSFRQMFGHGMNFLSFWNIRPCQNCRSHQNCQSRQNCWPRRNLWLQRIFQPRRNSSQI